MGPLFAALLTLLAAGCGQRNAPAKQDIVVDQRRLDGRRVSHDNGVDVPASCKIDACRIGPAPGTACCFSEPQVGFSVCCYGKTAAIETFACNADESQCLMFCDSCLPQGWKPFSLPSCTYDQERVCWTCNLCPLIGHAVVACSAPQHCALFCTDCLAAGYTKCSYGSSTEADPACLGWQAPKGQLSGCSITGKRGGADLYCCPFCPSSANVVKTARDQSGKCYQFCTSCVPEGFTLADCTP
jgi:hypothetical protein